MADRDIKDRLSPPLMYVFRAAHEAHDAQKTVDLRDDSGERIIASRRLRPRQVVTEQMLRRDVARDLDSLLNTISMSSTIEMSSYPFASKSILNFGIPDLTHRTIDEAGVDDIPDEIRSAILNFEPRLAPASLQIERDNTVDTAELKIRFLVKAELVCHPVHVPVEFVADLIEPGKILVNRL